MIKVKINGEEKSVDSAATVGELLRDFGYNPARVAVEKNGEIIPRGEFESAAFKDGDKVEIVGFVGGG